MPNPARRNGSKRIVEILDMAHILRLAGIACLCAVFASCGSDNGSTSPPTATSQIPTSAATVQSSPRETEPTPQTDAESVDPMPPALAPVPSPPMSETAAVEAPVVEEPYIVDCQMGLGPIVTYWSDGTVTGYSDYCQSVHDRVLQGEIEANTPECDGTVCRYPSGATMPDPNAAPDDRCTNQINYAGDPRSNAEINSIGAETGQCPAPMS